MWSVDLWTGRRRKRKRYEGDENPPGIGCLVALLLVVFWAVGWQIYIYSGS